MASRAIAFGYPVAGLAVNILIQRVSDGWFWNGTGYQAAEPVPALSMLYDGSMRMYYSDELPTAQSNWTAIQVSTNQPIYFGDYGGGFPETVTPPSATTYTMAEVINRIRVDIRDPNQNLYTNEQLLILLDSCNDWLTQQCFNKQSTLGLKKATYTGDGTLEWGMPSDFFGLAYFANPSLFQDLGELEEVPKSAYDSGELARRSTGTRYYARVGNQVYFVHDIANGTEINCYYYPRNVKLEISDLVPFDGVFLSLFHRWGTTQALTSDEFSAGFEKEMMSLFMNLAASHIRRAVAKRSVKVPNNVGRRRKVYGRIHTQRGRIR